MDWGIIKQIFVGVVITMVTVLGVKVSDVKLIEYRLTKVEEAVQDSKKEVNKKLDSIIKKINR